MSTLSNYYTLYIKLKCRLADSKRTLYALGLRITFASLLLITIAYGFYSGELRMGVNAPWHAAQAAQAAGE